MSEGSSGSVESDNEDLPTGANDNEVDAEKDLEEIDGMEEPDEKEQENVEADCDLLPYDEYSTITAMPPKILAFEENHMEVSASPAFHVLDVLFNEGKLTATKLMMLKEKYTELHESLKNKRNNEQRLLQKAKEYTSQVTQQKLELEKADQFPENSTTEVSKLRQTLLTYHNDLAETEERQYQLDYKIRCLEEDKKMVLKEHGRLPKPGELEKKQEELKTSITDLRKEINQRNLEIKSLREDLELNARRNEMDAKSLEQLHEQAEILKSELVGVSSKPVQIMKDLDRFERQRADMDQQTKVVDSETKQLLQQLQDCADKMQQLDVDKTRLEAELRSKEAVHRDKERKIQELMKDLEYAKERETVLIVDRATLDLNLRHMSMELTNVHDAHARRMRDKDAELRKLKKADLQLKIARENVEHVKQVYEQKKSEVALLPKDDGSMQKKVEELRKEVEQLKRSLAREGGMAKHESEKIDQCVAEGERLLYEQSDLHVEVVELTRLASIKRDEKAQKLRDRHRAEQHFMQVKQDVQVRQLQIEDYKKKAQEMQIKLKEFAQLYDVIKSERNKCVSLIQASTQKSCEMKEKVKIFENEIEILRTSVAQKEKQLQKHRMRFVNSMIVRDSLRTEVSKQRAIVDDMREKQDQLRIDIAKLNLLINQSENQMLELRKRYEAEIQRRNDRGVQLVERNEEVCIFMEKTNVQEQMVRNGNVELTAREEEIRFLKLKLAEEQRKIDVLRKNLPSKRVTEQELVTLQIQLSLCQDRIMELEGKIEDPNNEERIRLIEGNDPEPVELKTKIEELEARLAMKEEQHLEKELVLDQVSRLTDRVANLVRVGKDDTLALAKQVNGIQSRLKGMTRKMMAKVSELSMHQANALRLQQEVKEKEAALEQCYINMEKGLPPDAEIEREWQRQVQVDEQRAIDRETAHAATEREQAMTLPGGAITTADPRPNAYIPMEEHELPIPRPYGAHAPFKPSEQGSTMRHIRKPNPKPIEI